MSIPKNHHYVPQSYQKNFINPESGKLFFYDKISKEAKPLNPRNLLSENYLYSLEYPSEKYPSHYIESFILSPLDGRYNSAIKDLSSENPILDKLTLSIYLGFLRRRTPDMINNVKGDIESKALKEIYLFISSNDILSAKANEVDIKMNDFDSFAHSLNGIRVETNRDTALSGFLLSAIYTAVEFHESRWTIIKSEEDLFITSDTPVCCAIFEESDGAEIEHYIIPLSSNLALRIDRESGDDLTAIGTRAKIEEINDAVAYCANRWLIGGDTKSFFKADN